MIQGVARVDNSFVQTMIEFNTGTQAQLNFVSDLEFYNEVMMCLQMVSYKPCLISCLSYYGMYSDNKSFKYLLHNVLVFNIEWRVFCVVKEIRGIILEEGK